MTREEEAIKNLEALLLKANITDVYGDMEDMTPYEDAVNMAIQALKREPAHWTIDFICSNCGCKCYLFDIDFGDYNYCPNCGSEMKEGD